MNLSVLSESPIQTAPNTLGDRVITCRSIDAPDAFRLDGGFSCDPGRHITLAQINTGKAHQNTPGLMQQSPVISARFHLDGDDLTHVSIARTQAYVTEIFRMDDASMSASAHAQVFLESPHGQCIESFAGSCREFLNIPDSDTHSSDPWIDRIRLVEEALNHMYTRVILLYMIQHGSPNVRVCIDRDGNRGTHVARMWWPQAGTGEVFQATAPLRRVVSNLNLQVLDILLDGRTISLESLRLQLQ